MQRPLRRQANAGRRNAERCVPSLATRPVLLSLLLLYFVGCGKQDAAQSEQEAQLFRQLTGVWALESREGTQPWDVLDVPGVKQWGTIDNVSQALILRPDSTYVLDLQTHLEDPYLIRAALPDHRDVGGWVVEGAEVVMRRDSLYTAVAGLKDRMGLPLRFKPEINGDQLILEDEYRTRWHYVRK